MEIESFKKKDWKEVYDQVYAGEKTGARNGKLPYFSHYRKVVEKS